jgi:phage regulator Rha-like protein
MKEKKMKNDLIVLDGLTNKKIIRMTSVEIAKLTEKKHKHVLRDIEIIIEDENNEEIKEVIARPKFGTGNTYENDSDQNLSIIKTFYKDKNNQPRSMYELDYESTMILISGYSLKLRKRIIRRWIELENKKNSYTRREIATMIIEAEDAIEEAKKRAEEAEDKVYELETEIENSIMFPDIPVKEKIDKKISLTQIKEEFVPFIPTFKIAMILKYYGIEKGIFVNSKKMPIEMFEREGVEEALNLFKDEADISLAGSGMTIIIKHDSLLGQKIHVNKEVAINFGLYYEIGE